MTAVRGFTNLIDRLRELAGSGGHIYTSGLSTGMAQLTILACLDAAHRGEAPWRDVVVVLPRAKDVSQWSRLLDYDLPSLYEGATQAGAVLPSHSSYGKDRYVNPTVAKRGRIHALGRLLDPSAPSLVVGTVKSLAQKTLPPDEMRAATLELSTSGEWDMDELAEALVSIGYVQAQAVEEAGQFSLRGGIVDVYPLNALAPVRLEFMGDQILSIRAFDPSSQRSREALDSIAVAPAEEALTPEDRRKQDVQALYDSLREGGVEARDRDGMVSAFQHKGRFSGFEMFQPLFRSRDASAFDYMGPRTLTVFPATEDSCREAYREFTEETAKAFEADRAAGRPTLPPERHFLADDEVEHEWHGGARPVLEFGNPFATSRERLLRFEARTKIEGAPMGGGVSGDLFDKWADVIGRVTASGGSVAVLAHHEDQLQRVRNLLSYRGMEAKEETFLLGRLCAGSLEAGAILLGEGELNSDLWLEDRNLLLLPEQALFGTAPRRKKPASAKLANYLSSFKDLKAGDLVVHVEHGIARYQGMTGLEVSGERSDFLILEFAGGDRIYLPVDRLSLLQRYSTGSEKAAPTSLDKLGGTGFEKRKGRVKKAVRDMAEQLLGIQARRALATGHAYSPPDDTYLKFEGAFPYEETDDQARAIADVEHDLREAKPMDRLICGDVGFGKTEVALRAMIRAILEGYQVLVLVPTTVLCHQHFRTFQERLRPFGVRVAQANRFVKGRDLREALEGLSRGTVDVLVGTHRILSKDIKPKRLGLLVIDEEQRFGVAHKEKLKELKSGTDVITLSATPIPRTLHMAMVGLRDISIIATPPQDRLAVKTYIAHTDETLVREAIETEVARGGQVFFVHNRVEDIEETRLFVASLVPHLDVRAAHGQMREHQLERVILDFLDKKFPVLVCTTIIESGVDMPNVNTLIVNRADRFGLAQLYQLRGRVGRSSMQAYAYFLTPSGESLTDDAKKRLDVLAAHQELGAGFQIASHDLEIRGAGNLLGGEQSGHAAAVGLEMYTQMLESAIHELKGQPSRETVDTEIKLPVSAALPEDYVPDENLRLQLYKSLFGAETQEELRGLADDIKDRFGPPPPVFSLLYRLARLKQLLRQAEAKRLVALGRDGYEIEFGTLEDSKVDRLLAMVNRRPDRYQLAPGHKLRLNADARPRSSQKEQMAVIDELIELVDPLVEDEDAEGASGP